MFEALNEREKAQQAWNEVIASRSVSGRRTRLAGIGQVQRYFAALAQRKLNPGTDVDNVFSELINSNSNLAADSLHVELKRTNRHFQLAERQFHWLTEQTK